MNYYTITLPHKFENKKQVIKVKTQKTMGDIVRFFIGDIFSCHDISSNGGRNNYKIETKYNGIVYCKQITKGFHKLNDLEFITV